MVFPVGDKLSKICHSLKETIPAHSVLSLALS